MPFHQPNPTAALDVNREAEKGKETPYLRNAKGYGLIAVIMRMLDLTLIRKS